MSIYTPKGNTGIHQSPPLIHVLVSLFFIYLPRFVRALHSLPQSVRLADGTGDKTREKMHERVRGVFLQRAHFMPHIFIRHSHSFIFIFIFTPFRPVSHHPAGVGCSCAPSTVLRTSVRARAHTRLHTTHIIAIFPISLSKHTSDTTHPEEGSVHKAGDDTWLSV